MEEIFEKNLLLLIPLYIFSHEKRFDDYEKDKVKLGLLQEEYERIKNKLEELLNYGAISEYTRCTINDMSNKEGMEWGIEGTVSILKNLGVPTQTILQKI